MIDTAKRAENFQIELFRRASTSERVRAAIALSETVRAMSYEAIRKENPKLSERELDLKFVEIHYGRDLAARVRERLFRT